MGKGTFAAVRRNMDEPGASKEVKVQPEDPMKLSDVLIRPALVAALLAPAALAQEKVVQEPAPHPAVREPPVAKKIEHVTQINGTTLKDNYFWIRDKQDPDVMKYLEAEN